MKWLQCAPMKRLLLVAALAIAFPAVASAEDAKASADTSLQSGTWINGVKLGLAVSTLGGDTNSEISSQQGSAVAYFFSYRLGGGLAIQPEVMVTQRGALDSTYNESGRDADLLYTYIDLPILGRYNFQIMEGVGAYGFAGPMLSINIDSSRLVGTSARDWDSETSNIDFGATAGIGFDYLIKNGVGVTVDARYTMGFLDTDALDDNTSLTNRSFIATVGIWK